MRVSAEGVPVASSQAMITGAGEAEAQEVSQASVMLPTGTVSLTRNSSTKSRIHNKMIRPKMAQLDAESANHEAESQPLLSQSRMHDGSAD